jgi:two-component system LytT family sensor kinase
MATVLAKLRRIPAWLAILAGWILFGLFTATQSYVTRMYLGRVTWRPVLLLSLAEAMIWAGMTPAIVALVRKFSSVRIGWPRAIGAHMLLGLAFALIEVALLVQVTPYLGYAYGKRSTQFQVLLPSRLQSNLLLYLVLVGVIEAVGHYRRYRERELRASQLEANLAHARYQVLQMQLQPHFLFNALNTISSLMYKDVPAADRVLNRLASFLRLTIEKADAQEVSLATELEFTDRYLEIEQVRFADRVRVEKDTDPDALAAQVPVLILQPLVENAIRHGLVWRARGGTIWMRARRDGERLLLEVEDDGEPPPEIHEGVGLRNTRSRLAALYGESQHFSAGRGARGGFCVTLEIPYRRAAA